jgi:hypothetical protein
MELIDNKIYVDIKNADSISLDTSTIGYAENFVNKPITFSMEIENIETDDDHFQVELVPFYHGYDYFGTASLTKENQKGSLTIMFTEQDLDFSYGTDFRLNIFFGHWSETNDYSFVIKNIQIEIGSEVTEYEPYYPPIDYRTVTVTNGKETANFDESGTAYIKSTGKDTTLTLNRDDVSFKSTYFVDQEVINEAPGTSDLINYFNTVIEQQQAILNKQAQFIEEANNGN